MIYMISIIAYLIFAVAGTLVVVIDAKAYDSCGLWPWHSLVFVVISTIFSMYKTCQTLSEQHYENPVTYAYLHYLLMVFGYAWSFFAVITAPGWCVREYEEKYPSTWLLLSIIAFVFASITSASFVVAAASICHSWYRQRWPEEEQIELEHIENGQNVIGREQNAEDLPAREQNVEVNDAV